MHRLIFGTFFCFFLLLIPCSASFGAWFSWNDDNLVTIDGNQYSADDFRSWWNNWREPGMHPPVSPDPFIDWMLLFREADRMKLYEDPGYRKKALIFLKARTLMLLKAEEVDSKIDLTDQELWERYLQSYAPLYQINILHFQSREDADKFLAETGPEPISDEKINELATLASGESEQLVKTTTLSKVETGWYRKVSVNPGWYDIIDGLEPGKLSDPLDWMNGAVILRLQERKEGDKDDFATVRKDIHEKLWKERANDLTLKLVESLREKYHVQVDHERLAELDINAADDSFSDQPIVTTDQGNVSEREFMAQVRRMQRFRQQSGFKDDESIRYKEQVLDGILSQSLTSWEGLARGYEKESPFKEIYEFYGQHRLIKSLESKVLEPQAKVTPDEVRAYYEEHKDEFSNPEIVRMVSAEGSREMMNTLWTKVAMGGDFRTLARDMYDRPLPVRDVPVHHLSPEVLAVVEKLTKNEVSQVFAVNDHASLVQLIERIPAQPAPLARVGKMIEEKLFTERMDRVRREYISKLRAGSSISVNDEVWQQLTTEMEQADVEETR